MSTLTRHSQKADSGEENERSHLTEDLDGFDLLPVHTFC